jgi:hypothetical protein
VNVSALDDWDCLGQTIIAVFSVVALGEYVDVMPLFPSFQAAVKLIQTQVSARGAIRVET